MISLFADSSIVVARAPGRPRRRLLLACLVGVLLLAALFAPAAFILPPSPATGEHRGTLAPVAAPETVLAVLGSLPSWQAGGRLGIRYTRPSGGSSPLLPAAARFIAPPTGAALRVGTPPPSPAVIHVRPTAPRAPPACC